MIRTGRVSLLTWRRFSVFRPANKDFHAARTPHLCRIRTIVFSCLFLFCLLCLKSALSAAEPVAAKSQHSLLPADWNPKAAADEVLKRLVCVTAEEVKGAHDAEMVLLGNHAYIVAEVNDQQAGESAGWHFIYSALSIVNLQTLKVEAIIPFAKSEQQFANEKLPSGSCFVPRIIQKNAQELRCYFASEAPKERQAQTWYIDFDLETRKFSDQIHKAKIQTESGTFPMQPQYFYADAARHGFSRKPVLHGLYLFDSFKEFDGKTYVAINNYPGRQNALAVVNESLDTFKVIGHFNEPQSAALCEAAVNRLPDGTWLAIIRQDGGNYMFSNSSDGKNWTTATYRDAIPHGSNSKPTFDKFDGVYYLGWQDADRVNNVGRSVFNMDISRDGVHWERKYRFETAETFQYPTFRKHNGSIWLCATQGQKERIMFGKLEEAK